MYITILEAHKLFIYFFYSRASPTFYQDELLFFCVLKRFGPNKPSSFLVVPINVMSQHSMQKSFKMIGFMSFTKRFDVQINNN